MLVTGEGIVFEVEEVNDLWLADLFSGLFGAADTLVDEASDDADDMACFLQDADVNTPMDEYIDMPLSLTFIDLELW